MLICFDVKKTIPKHKHDQVLEQECDAAKALMNRKLIEKVIFHFDSTTRSRIDGDWPSLILNIALYRMFQINLQFGYWFLRLRIVKKYLS